MTALGLYFLGWMVARAWRRHVIASMAVHVHVTLALGLQSIGAAAAEGANAAGRLALALGNLEAQERAAFETTIADEDAS
jgi:hypothetical protein